MKSSPADSQNNGSKNNKNEADQSNEKQTQKQRFEQIIYEHFQKSRGLVKKIKNIKNRKRQKKNKHLQRTKAKKYQARVQRDIMSKTRKRRLRRQALHSW